MAGNNGGPWGGGGGQNGDGGNRGNNGGGKKPQDNGPQIPEIDEIVKKGQEQLRVLMGGRGGRGGSGGGAGAGAGQGGPGLTKGTVGLGLLAVAAFWAFNSFYTVKPEEQSIELFLGEFSSIGNPGLNFAPWPIVTKEIRPVTREQIVNIGVGVGGEAGLMLTGDENIVDIDFQVVWNINDLQKFLFELKNPNETIAAVSESAMREIIAQSDLAPILNRDRGLISSKLQDLIQQTLDSYHSGVNIVRVNFDKADPPADVIDAFHKVQEAEQIRDRLVKEADTYANKVLAGARGEAAQVLQKAESYRAQVVNDAQGEASRFLAVLTEYEKAPEVTRKRLYLETMEQVLGDVNKVIIDENTSGGGQGVVPYLPLNQLTSQGNN